MKNFLFLLPLLLCLAACSHALPERRLASLQEDVNDLDKNRKTVCTVTLNSDDEKDVFESKLKGFNFIELTNKDNGDWLKKACESKVQCDVLLISGHFAGTFFGKSGLRLPLATLENTSCSNTCPGIFEKPKEVFLMGCNTLAGKKLDSRGPEEYVRVLMADGFSRQQAEQVAAARYSSIGSSNLQRMRMAFPGANTKLYGFDSIGPAGTTVRPFLEKYLSAVPNYDSYLGQWDSKSLNTRLAEALKVTSFAQALPSTQKMNNPACVLGSNRRIVEKLTWINQVLSDDRYALAYVPNIMEYFRQADKSFNNRWPEAEASYLEDIQQNKGAKERLLRLVDKPTPGILSQQAEILNFSREVGWLSDRAYRERSKALVGGFFRNNLTLEQKDSICSAEVHLELSKDELPRERWTENTLEAIGCLKARGPGVEETLVNDMQKADVPIKLRAAAIVTLGKLAPLSEDTQRKMLAYTQSKDDDLRAASLYAFSEAGSTIEPVHLALIDGLQKQDDLAFSLALDGIKNSSSLTPKAENALLALVRDPNVPGDIYSIVGPRQISSPSGRNALFALLKDRNPEVVSRAMWTLWEAGWTIGPDLQKTFAEQLNHPSDDVRGSAVLYFTQENPNPLSEQVENILLGFLRKGKPDVKARVLELLSMKDEVPRPSTRMEIIKNMENTATDIRYRALNIAERLCPLEPAVRPVLQRLTQDSDKDIKKLAERTLKDCGR